MFVYINIEKEMGRVFPEMNKVRLGQNTYFSCKSNERPSWYFQDSESLPKNTKVEYAGHIGLSFLRIIEIHDSNEGYYSCYGIKLNKTRQFVDYGHLSTASEYEWLKF